MLARFVVVAESVAEDLVVIAVRPRAETSSAAASELTEPEETNPGCLLRRCAAGEPDTSDPNEAKIPEPTRVRRDLILGRGGRRGAPGHKLKVNVKFNKHYLM